MDNFNKILELFFKADDEELVEMFWDIINYKLFDFKKEFMSMTRYK